MLLLVFIEIKGLSLSFVCLPLLFNRCLSSRSILRGFSTTRFVLEFNYIALRSTRRWPFLEFKLAEFWFGGGVGGGGGGGGDVLLLMMVMVVIEMREKLR